MSTAALVSAINMVLVRVLMQSYWISIRSLHTNLVLMFASSGRVIYDPNWLGSNPLSSIGFRCSVGSFRAIAPGQMTCPRNDGWPSVITAINKSYKIPFAFLDLCVHTLPHYWSRKSMLLGQENLLRDDVGLLSLHNFRGIVAIYKLVNYY